MARSWSLVQTFDLRDAQTLNTNGYIGVGDGIIYFYATSEQGVYSWNGTTLVDLDPGNFFGDNNLFIADITVFGGQVYVLAGNSLNAGEASLYKYTGSSWSLQWDVIDGSSNPGLIGNPPSAFQSFLDCDASKICLAAMISISSDFVM